ncbi:hypothetical protein NLU13_6752 [Sarocladium strictum]|uniref:Peroxisomal membrane protein PEX14 n=1 Tax=Sarocladium strictum TaxID=5046 RepID=A0AA39GEM7_SARSR|nr:hypothetical protein NLU13_6752 [Sarocladium strictum]
MGDSEDKPAIPSWQRNKPSDAPEADNLSGDGTTSETASSTPATAEDQLGVARRFLRDDAVKNESREKKVSFLKEKGISDSDIETLLAELPSAQTSDTESTTNASTYSNTSSSSSPPSSTTTLSTTDRPPIVTYPEFLTQPAQPPPLVTTTALVTTLSTFAGLATLLHGTSRYLIQPMHESLTEARLDFHATASQRLDALVSRLEEAVSVVPPLSFGKRSAAAGDDTDSEADDPTEMFHRDISTQTANLEELAPAASTTPAPSPSEAQATRLQELVSSLQPVNESFRTQSTDFDDIGTLIDVFRDDLQAMGGKSSQSIYGLGSGSAYGGYSYQLGSLKEPDDEIKKARDGIRRIKGLLLSTRNFPASTA